MFSSEQDILLQEYALLDDYKDEQREITMFKDDVVEILDISKPEKWLVKTKYKNLIQVTNRSSAYHPAIFIYLNELLFLLFSLTRSLPGMLHTSQASRADREGQDPVARSRVPASIWTRQSPAQE